MIARPWMLIAFILLAACRPSPAAMPTTVPTAAPVASPTTAPVVTAVTPTDATATAQWDATAAPEAVLVAPAATDPIFDVAWDDRAPFAAGLRNAAADDVPGAPVYHIAFDIDDSLSALSGRQLLYYTNREDVALTELYFHLHPNLLDGRIEVSDVTVDGAAAPSELSGANDGILRVDLAQPLPPGALAVVGMEFDVSVATEIGRNYGVLAYYDGILALAHAYPMVSVYDAGGWNTTEAHIQGDLTYSDAGYYLVQVSAPDGVTLVGSGVALDAAQFPAAEAAGDGRQTVTYAVGPARDFYLAAGPFVVQSATVDGTTINSYAPAEMADGAALALDVAAAALQENNRRLSPYPYTELDIVTTPTSALGIEYPGLIVGTLRMYDLDGESASGIPWRDYLESTTAHEVVHQWFYNIVGNDQLDEPWLDESVTGYNTYRYYVARYGQQVGDAYFETFGTRWAQIDNEAWPIGLPVAAYPDNVYVPIVYGRGAVFVRELEETMGRAAFDAFQAAYTAELRWENATTADFRALAESHCDCDLGPLFDAWVYE